MRVRITKGWVVVIVLLGMLALLPYGWRAGGPGSSDQRATAGSNVAAPSEGRRATLPAEHDAPSLADSTRESPTESRGVEPSATSASAPSDDGTDGEEYASLDDAPWPEVERRLEVAIERAREQRQAHVAANLLARLREEGSVRIIVGQRSVRSALPELVAGTRHDAMRFYEHIPFAVVSAGPQAIENLLESSGVSSIELALFARPTEVASGTAARPLLQDSIGIIDAQVPIDAGADGTGYTIVVIDSGVDLSHSFFAGRIVGGHCYSRDALCPNGEVEMIDDIDAGAPCSIDGCDHGTHVAGIALGDGAARTGVAPGATLISIQAGSRDPDDPDNLVFAHDDTLAALNKVYSLRDDYSIAAVNMSFGGAALQSEAECDQMSPSRLAITQLLRDAGIASVSSSGNDSTTDGIGSPACLSTVISVGSTTKADGIPDFSNAASFLDLLAPGQNITSSVPGGGYESKSGTSMSAPHVAGAFASLLTAAPDANVDDVLDALKMTGEPILEERNGLTFPRINIRNAITLISSWDLRSDSEKVFDELASPKVHCGLVGLELLLPLVWLRASARARWRSGRTRQKAT